MSEDRRLPESHEYLTALARRAEELVVTGLGDSTTDWSQFAPQERHLPICGAMGHAMSVALGLAVERPEQRFIAIEGDGGVALNLGALLTLAAVAPPNLLVLVLNNGVYASSGGQAIPTALESFSAVARACGMPHAAEIDSVESLIEQHELFAGGWSPGLLSLRVALRTVPRYPFGRRPAEIHATFRRTLGSPAVGKGS
jgi:sulfopyruvate decarboxylase subunit beta